MSDRRVRGRSNPPPPFPIVPAREKSYDETTALGRLTFTPPPSDKSFNDEFFSAPGQRRLRSSRRDAADSSPSSSYRSSVQSTSGPPPLQPAGRHSPLPAPYELDFPDAYRGGQWSKPGDPVPSERGRGSEFGSAYGSSGPPSISGRSAFGTGSRGPTYGSERRTYGLDSGLAPPDSTAWTSSLSRSAPGPSHGAGGGNALGLDINPSRRNYDETGSMAPTRRDPSRGVEFRPPSRTASRYQNPVPGVQTSPPFRSGDSQTARYGGQPTSTFRSDRSSPPEPSEGPSHPSRGFRTSRTEPFDPPRPPSSGTGGQVRLPPVRDLIDRVDRQYERPPWSKRSSG